MTPYDTHTDPTYYRTAPTPAVLERIDSLQAICKRNPPDSPAWLWAETELKPLFALMAERQREGA